MDFERIHRNPFVRILIVDDHVGFRTALAQMLRREYPHSDVIEVGDREEALQRVAASPPDLAFIDVRLPGGSGLQLTQEIKAVHPPTAIVVLTGENLPEYRQAAAEHGASHYICKQDMSMDAVRVPVDAVLAAKAPQQARARGERASVPASETTGPRGGKRGGPRREMH